jgi:hypothetical protein
MNIGQWALRWRIPYAALIDLHTELGMLDPEPGEPGRSEAAVQAAVRVEASQKGQRLFRNNKGALPDSRGVPVRFGLCNDTARLGAKLRSADLIGIDPITITPAHVGQIIGQFVSWECKEEGWTYAGTPHEQAQAAWAALVVSLGGRARFINRVGLL